MLQTVSKAFFHVLAGSQSLKSLASRYGMRPGGGFARRFIAGETVDEAIAAARQIEASGLHVTLDYLGESVGSIAEADAATRAYVAIIEQHRRRRRRAQHLAEADAARADVDRATCVDNLRRILDAGAAQDFFVRIDMENSPYTEVTLDVFETMWQQGYRNAGVVLQSCLPRSEADAARMNALGARVRLVKGAYKEPQRRRVSVEGRGRRRVRADHADAAGRRHLPGHRDARSGDDRRDAGLRRRAQALRRDRFEFQMLYGIRRDLQSVAARREGYPRARLRAIRP